MESVVHHKGAPHGRAARKKGGHIPGQTGLVDPEIGHHAVPHADPMHRMPPQIRQLHPQIKYNGRFTIYVCFY